jgi:hypothetical protein
MLVALAVVLATGAPAPAQGVPRSGAHPPVPEHVVPYDRNIELRAQLVVDRTGAAPLALDTPVQLRFDLSLRALDGAKPADLSLTCRMVIVGTDGAQTPLREGPCFTGPLPAPGRWVPVGQPVRFRPDRHAAAGSGGVLVEVRSAKGRPKRLMATYGWAPGP